MGWGGGWNTRAMLDTQRRWDGLESPYNSGRHSRMFCYNLLNNSEEKNHNAKELSLTLKIIVNSFYLSGSETHLDIIQIINVNREVTRSDSKRPKFQCGKTIFG